MQYHPKLKKAMAEINAILEKHDIAGLIVLQMPGFVEYRLAINPTWSVAKWNGDELRVKAKLQEDYNGDKEAWTEDVTNTLNMLQSLADCSGQHAVNLFEIADKINKKVNADHRRGGHSSNTTQNN